MVVAVRQRVIHVGHIEIEPVGDRLGFGVPFLEEGGDLTDADPPPADVWLAEEVVSDTPDATVSHTC